MKIPLSSEPGRRRAQSLVLVLLVLSAAAALAGWACIVAGHASYFDGYFANGAFQLLNPLRRLMDGQLPGQDFLVFHGIGTIWLHLPIYLLLGQDFPAAEASRFLTSGLLHCVACIWLWRTLATRTDRRTAACLALLFFAAAAFTLDRLVLPQNSLLGTRSIFPLFVALALVAAPGGYRLALLVGAALFVGPEHGLAAVFGLALTACLCIAGSTTRRQGMQLALSALVACAVFIALVWLASGGALSANLRYAFQAIPGDQFWYFGVRPNSYLPIDWTGLFEAGFYVFAGLWCAAGVLTVAMWRSGSPYRFAAVFLLVYASFGTVSQLGYLAAANLQGSQRALILILVLAAANWHQVRPAPLFALAALIGIAAWGWASRDGVRHAWPQRGSGDGEFLSPYWRAHLVAVESHADGGAVWSIYAGLPEAARGRFAPSFDYIIHALGPQNRRQYVAAFDAANPALVRLDNALTWGYGGWLISSNWDFYKRVFERYELVHSDKMATLWAPGASRRPAITSGQRVPVRDLCFPLEGDAAGDAVYSVRVRYALDNPWARLPLIGQTPRIVLAGQPHGEHRASLPPPQLYGGQWELPLVVRANEHASFCFRTDSFLPRLRLRVDEVEVTRADLTDSAKRYLTDIGK